MLGSGSWWGKLGALMCLVALLEGCGETENSGSEGAGGTGSAGSAGAPGVGIPAGCEMLAEKHPNPS